MTEDGRIAAHRRDDPALLLRRDGVAVAGRLLRRRLGDDAEALHRGLQDLASSSE